MTRMPYPAGLGCFLVSECGCLSSLPLSGRRCLGLRGFASVLEIDLWAVEKLFKTSSLLMSIACDDTAVYGYRVDGVVVLRGDERLRCVKGD